VLPSTVMKTAASQLRVILIVTTSLGKWESRQTLALFTAAARYVASDFLRGPR
jgi:hypothetical protein